MRTIGLLGGMSWESSIEYYRMLNEAVRERLGGLHSAECVMWSVDFAAIEQLQRSGDWDEAGRRLAGLARRLGEAGAECLVLCTNTMHRLADELQAAIDIPLLHIADATARRIKAAGIDSVGLLATRYTMEQDFYRGRLAELHGLQVLVPPEPDLTLVHDVIYQELCQGRVLDGSRDQYRRVIGQLEEAGADGIIYGCTEIDLLVGPHDASVPVFDSTRIHVEAAVEWALAGGPDVELHRTIQEGGLGTGPTLRAGTVDDAEQLARVAIDGFEVYREFAPPEWEPPPVEAEIALLRDLLVEESTWCRLAEVDGRVVGQITFLPAARASMPVDEPGLAHLRNLFVDREYWGSGLAAELHRAAIVAARERGFSQMRLFTPVAQARARRFYEREGWARAGDEFHSPGPDLVIVEYRYPLTA